MKSLLLHTYVNQFTMAPLKVIGAGYGRTGTSSLRLALNMLGYVKFVSVLFNIMHSNPYDDMVI